jgi:hypothetical protein
MPKFAYRTTWTTLQFDAWGNPKEELESLDPTPPSDVPDAELVSSCQVIDPKTQQTMLLWVWRITL